MEKRVALASSAFYIRKRKRYVNPSDFIVRSASGGLIITSSVSTYLKKFFKYGTHRIILKKKNSINKNLEINTYMMKLLKLPR
jgi:hypothetical protein